MTRRFSALSRFVALAFLLGTALQWAVPVAPAFAQQETAGQGQAMQLPDDPDKLVIHTAQGEFGFTIEIADKPTERARGLMFRQTMAANHGMLFVFDDTVPVAMWMKNTPMPLDMVFIDGAGAVANIAERTEPFSETVIASAGPVAYVLELRAGTARLIGLKPGDKLDHPIFQPGN